MTAFDFIQQHYDDVREVGRFLCVMFALRTAAWCFRGGA